MKDCQHEFIACICTKCGVMENGKMLGPTKQRPHNVPTKQEVSVSETCAAVPKRAAEHYGFVVEGFYSDANLAGSWYSPHAEGALSLMVGDDLAGAEDLWFTVRRATYEDTEDEYITALQSAPQSAEGGRLPASQSEAKEQSSTQEVGGKQ